MRLRKFRWLGVVVVAVGCAEQASPGVDQSPIVNGDVLEPDDAVVRSVVGFVDKFDPNNPDKVRLPTGSGVLVGPTLVLTAQHVMKDTDTTKLDVKHGELSLDGSQDSTITTASVVTTQPYGSFTRRQARTRLPVAPDLAYVFVDRPFDNGNAIPADLDCELRHVSERTSQLGCVSAALQFKEPNPPPETGANPLMNEGVFDVKTPKDPFFTYYGPNAPKSTAPGDSGMGCMLPASRLVHSIHKTSTGDPLEKRKGKGTTLAPYCDWLRPFVEANRLLGPQPEASNEVRIDSDNQRDIARLTRVAGEDLLLTLERSQVGDQTFPVKVSGAQKIAAVTVGNFNGQGQSLAVIADGALKTVSFNGGPQPTISGATGNDYVTLIKAPMNGGNVDDLVAQRKNGQIDVFIGGASGLQLNAAIKPEPLHLNDDLLPDFAWLTGGAGVSVSNSRFGQSFREVVGQNGAHDITLADIRTGHSRRGTGAELGAEDIVVIGDDPAGGGVVISCESNGNGVVCKPAIEARFATGRDPVAIEMEELSGDELDDLIISYADGTQQKIRATPNGFPSLTTSNPEPQIADEIISIFSGSDLLAVEVAEDGGNVLVRTFNDNGDELAIVDTGFARTLPVLVQSANFNADGVDTALEAGQAPIEDLAIVSGGRVFALIGDGSGSFTVTPLNTPTDVVSIATGDVTGDGVDDLSVTRADRSVTVFAGSATGLVAPENFTGLPTADSTDGKMLLLSGLGVDTVGTTQMRMRLRVGPGDTAALDHLNVQVFDGDNGGLHQFEEQTNLLKTCFRLSADPCGDGNSGNCTGGPIQPIHLVTVSSDSLGDNKWDSIYKGPHSAQASLTGNGLPPFTYELRAYLSQDCSVIPTSGSQLQVATADAFKVRSNAMVSQPLGEFSLVGSDSDGSFGVPGLPYMTSTTFDGTFNLPISVGSSATEILLKESDADDTQDATPGVSLGANAAIQYRLLKPDGTAASVISVGGSENTTAATTVTNPSGNNNGQTATDVETRRHAIVGNGAGVWTWQWQNVMATNAIHVFSPFGSPTTHEVMGALRVRPTVSSAQDPEQWKADAALQAELPIMLGSESSDGYLEGSGSIIDTVALAQNVLENPSSTLLGELERQLFTAKLNWQRGLGVGEDIKGALVYGRTKTVRAVLENADAVVSGVDGLADDAKVADLVALLSAINLGELNYQQPGVPFPEEPMADDDADGIVNFKDNCPSLANPEQEDADDNMIGDVCHVAPLAVCVLERSETEREAVLGYDNPLTFRGIPQGARNLVSYNGQALWETTLPTELGQGANLDAFRYPLDRGDALTWELDGETVVVDDSTPACSGRELTNVALAPKTVLYGSESVVIGERSSVAASGSDLASIVSGGDVVLEARSSVDNVLAVGQAVVGDYAAVRGAAATSGGVSRTATAFVKEARSFTARPHSLAWWVGFESEGLDDVSISASQQRTLAPGDYGDVVVASRGQLLLSAGHYRFRSLVVLEQGSLRIGEGEVVVHVQSRLRHAGDTRLAETAQLVLGYLGVEAANIDASLEAAIVAPNAELTLGAVRQSVYVGSFAARRIVLRPETQVAYASSGG